MIVVFDIGATRTRMALVEGGDLGEIHRFDTEPSRAGFGIFLRRLNTLTHSKRIEAVVGCFPAQLDEDGVLYQATNLPEWEGLAAVAALRELAHCPVYIQNDVALGGLGEAWMGAGTRDGVMAYFTVSTGVNAVRIVQGRIDQTIAHYDIGRQLVMNDKAGPHTLEGLIGGAALTARTGRKPRDIRDPLTWDTEERFLAMGLYNTLIHWTPDVVVFGGSMMRDIDLADVKRSLLELPQLSVKLPLLRTAKLTDAAGLYGALAWYSQLEGYSPT